MEMVLKSSRPHKSTRTLTPSPCRKPLPLLAPCPSCTAYPEAAAATLLNKPLQNGRVPPTENRLPCGRRTSIEACHPRPLERHWSCLLPSHPGGMFVSLINLSFLQATEVYQGQEHGTTCRPQQAYTSTCSLQHSPTGSPLGDVARRMKVFMISLALLARAIIITFMRRASLPRGLPRQGPDPLTHWQRSLQPTAPHTQANNSAGSIPVTQRRLHPTRETLALHNMVVTWCLC